MIYRTISSASIAPVLNGLEQPNVLIFEFSLLSLYCAKLLCTSFGAYENRTNSDRANRSPSPTVKRVK
jgi:hypothetical protein